MSLFVILAALGAALTSNNSWRSFGRSGSWTLGLKKPIRLLCSFPGCPFPPADFDAALVLPRFSGRIAQLDSFDRLAIFTGLDMGLGDEFFVVRALDKFAGSCCLLNALCWTAGDDELYAEVLEQSSLWS